MTGRLADFVEAHGRALLLIALSFALAGIIFIFRLPISNRFLGTAIPTFRGPSTWLAKCCRSRSTLASPRLSSTTSRLR